MSNTKWDFSVRTQLIITLKAFSLVAFIFFLAWFSNKLIHYYFDVSDTPRLLINNFVSIAYRVLAIFSGFNTEITSSALINHIFYWILFSAYFLVPTYLYLRFISNKLNLGQHIKSAIIRIKNKFEMDGKFRLFIFHLSIYTAVFLILSIRSLSQMRSQNILSWENRGTAKNIDSLYGYSYPPDTFRFEASFKNGKKLAEGTYTFDDFGRRITPHDSTRSKALIFFGCSYTYGEGVSDSTNLPAVYFATDTTVNTYNYGIHGYGTAQVLLKLQRINWSEQVKEKEVSGVYIFIRDHINRVKGVPVWSLNFPYYEWKNDSVIYKGSFMRGWPLAIRLYRKLQQLDIVRGPDVNYNYSQSDYELEARLIEECRREFRRKFASDNFYVLLYPAEAGDLKRYLKKYPVHVLDYDSLFENPSAYIIPDYNHPTTEGYRKVAAKLFSDIGPPK